MCRCGSGEDFTVVAFFEAAELSCDVVLKSLLDLDHSHIRALLEADLSSAKGIQECTKAANALLKCMSAEIHPCMNLLCCFETNI